jgi:hypothetical protein
MRLPPRGRFLSSWKNPGQATNGCPICGPCGDRMTSPPGERRFVDAGTEPTHACSVDSRAKEALSFAKPAAAARRLVARMRSQATSRARGQLCALRAMIAARAISRQLPAGR